MKKIFKHFQYLIQTSNHVIKEFGLLYFLNFGFLQLREQNLDLFRPRKESEFSTIPTNPKKLDYDLWKNEHDIKIKANAKNLFKA